MDRVAVHNYDDWASALFYWGVPRDDIFCNQFMFNGKGDVANPDWTTGVGEPFLMGDFRYRNMRTMFSSTVNGIDLSLSLNFSASAGLDVGPLFFDFSFSIQDIPDIKGDPILDADIVTFSNTSSPAAFSYLETDYTLEMLGLSSDGGKTFLSGFTNPEGSSQTAGFYALISEAETVPLPPALLLMGIGLGGIVLLRMKPKGGRS